MRVRPSLCVTSFLLLILGLAAPLCLAEQPAGQAWDLWRDGNIAEALQAADAALAKAPADQQALHLRSLALFVRGKYREALETFWKVDPAYEKRAELGRSLLEACYHLNDSSGALALAKEVGVQDLAFFEARANKPFSVAADRTFTLPFVADSKAPLEFWPGVAAQINGQAATAMFDTGGAFLSMGKERAQALGIALVSTGQGKIASGDVTVQYGLVDRLELGDGLVFENVPVAALPKLDRVIFGTNLLEPFLATIDYPNSRFILTPRERKDLHAAHRAMLPANQASMPFYLWGDHFMFGKGVFGDRSGLTFFFDSGLVALTVINGKLSQAAFTASKERLMAWGFPESDLAASRFFQTDKQLGVAGLLQPDALVYFNVAQQEDRIFGGVRMDGLISHGWLSKYTWTIDFEAREYSFGTTDR
jgi:hypothetical protein